MDYLKLLGTGSIYASPVFAAVPGSNHGYDVTDPGMINPELGTFEDFVRIVQALKDNNIGWIQDIVPNHMAYHPGNGWIMDVLEKGVASPHFKIFDIEPGVNKGHEKLMTPFLGTDQEQAILNRDLQICLNKGAVAIKYFDNIYPANFGSFKLLFEPHLDTAPEEFRHIWGKYDLTNKKADAKFLNGDWEEIKKELDVLFNTNDHIMAFTGVILTGINSNPALLKKIISSQIYELCHWKDTSDRINYRRFFTINDLICINIEDGLVFDKHHHLISELISEGYLTGIRVDHIDGLYHPGGYLDNLRALAGNSTYLIVEKILERGEEIPATWPVQGTTGYDFLAIINNLMTSGKNYNRLLKLYQNLTGEDHNPDDLVYNNKKHILYANMMGELNNLFGRLEKLLNYDAKTGFDGYDEKKGLSPETMKQALAEFMLAFPVYRIYPGEFPLQGEQRELTVEIFKQAIRRNPGIKNSLSILRDIVLVDKKRDDEFNTLLGNFFMRLLQFTGPLTAKGVEDTSMYQYNCFIAHNEVGDALDARGISVENFHNAMNVRLQNTPLAMNCTATHDTKRGEDVRARLNAISDLAGEWEMMVKTWIEINRDIKKNSNEGGLPAPTLNEEYFIYQTLAGTFPFSEKVDEEYIRRIQDYLIKSLREAKQTSNWDDPDEKHEKGVTEFARSILDSRHLFINSFTSFHRKLVWRGIVNSLVQTVVKCCAPGMPDIYRGTETWDLSLVDPDNRRAVDFNALHDGLLKSIQQWEADPEVTIRDLYSESFDGRIKQLITHLLLRERKNNPDIFRYGDYIPVEPGGKYKDKVFGFIRKHRQQWIMCILPLNSGNMNSTKNGEYFSSVKWKDTFIKTPVGVPEEWKNLLTGKNLSSSEELEVSDLFGGLPVAVLKGKKKTSDRKCGLLLHISSLPGKYGIGDFGEEAFRFVDFLSQNYQTYWQTLPLSPVTRAQSWSPYSSPSAFAGNTTLISPWHLYTVGLINYSDLESAKFRNSSKINHGKASRFREDLLKKAWNKLRKETGHRLYSEFEKFCDRESQWLNDYTLFLAYKEHFGKKEWNRWPAKVKERDEKTLKTAKYEFDDIISQERFNQYIFDRQWRTLKKYANEKGIRIFGDIPYYVSYDSADVWANQDLFNLQEDGKMKTVAGVPPDYFDSNGQLWNMPVYNWQRLKDYGYDWWMKRLARNMEFFDLLRLDHFRAFSAFWEVPAGDKTAINGKWTKGPGVEFFNALKEKFPNMPFVAEDLGDIDQAVYDLRDQFGLPGMQVLQFGFDHNMSTNLHAPHNHNKNSLVYTGTHDNNTLRGWYDRDLGKTGKQRLQDYAGKKIGSSQLHWEMIRMAFASPARTAIIPMQDYMGLGKGARMNTPSTSGGNWTWKIKDLGVPSTMTEKIKKFTVMYNRTM